MVCQDKRYFLNPGGDPIKLKPHRPGTAVAIATEHTTFLFALASNFGNNEAPPLFLIQGS